MLCGPMTGIASAGDGKNETPEHSRLFVSGQSLSLKNPTLCLQLASRDCRQSERIHATEELMSCLLSFTVANCHFGLAHLVKGDKLTATSVLDRLNSF